KEKRTLSLGEHFFGESGLYILEGAIESEGNTFGTKQILVAKDTSLCEFTIEAESTIYIVGGDPFAEERFIDWNFVSSSKSMIEKAKQRWIAQEFEKIEGDAEDYVPYPVFKQ